MRIFGISYKTIDAIKNILDLLECPIENNYSFQKYEYIDNEEKLKDVLNEIICILKEDTKINKISFGDFPIIIHALKDNNLVEILNNFCEIYNFRSADLFMSLNGLFKREKENSINGDIFNSNKILKKFASLDFATTFDDGKDINGIHICDICIIGVSRTEKTPLSLYLSTMNYRVINIPLVPETDIPPELFQVPKDKIFGLTCSLDKLRNTRIERLKTLGLPDNAEYAKLERIEKEVKYACDVMKKLNCSIIDVTFKSVEETADIIIKQLK